jgi:hypothetical protein
MARVADEPGVVVDWVGVTPVNPRCMAPSLKAPYIQDAGPGRHGGKHHGAVGDGAIQRKHGAVGAGAVEKGQNVKYFATRFILC